MVERRQIRFSGRVQGVGFRVTTREIARRHPVTGWVRNEADGSVLVEVQGEAVACEAMLAQVQAIMGRNITHVHSMRVDAIPSEGTFEILR